MQRGLQQLALLLLSVSIKHETSREVKSKSVSHIKPSHHGKQVLPKAPVPWLIPSKIMPFCILFGMERKAFTSQGFAITPQNSAVVTEC